MQRMCMILAASVCLALTAGWGMTRESRGDGGAPPAEETASCGNNGTAVHFEDSPSIAARKAKKEHKLVFVLHVSGLFEDPRKT